jgi:hypothetical protein
VCEGWAGGGGNENDKQYVMLRDKNMQKIQVKETNKHKNPICDGCWKGKPV